MGVPARLGAASASSTLVARGACTEDKITTLLCLSGLVLTTDAKPLQRRCASRLPKEQSFVPRILEFVVCAVSVNVTSMALLAGPVLWQTRHLCLARSAGSSSLAERPLLKPVSCLRFRLKALGRVEPTRVFSHGIFSWSLISIHPWAALGQVFDFCARRPILGIGLG